MSPILVRPVREQLEHDRIIRLLQAKSKRKHEVGINPGAEQNAAVTGATGAPEYPDVILASPERGHKLQVVIEVETGESVNHLEALAQWTHYGKLRADFHLYVPAGMVDVARRLCEENQVRVLEIYSYHSVGDQIRFNLVHRNKDLPPLPPAPKAAKLAVIVAAPSAKKPAAKAPGKAPVKAKPAAKAAAKKPEPKAKAAPKAKVVAKARAAVRKPAAKATKAAAAKPSAKKPARRR